VTTRPKKATPVRRQKAPVGAGRKKK
jgi:hypothetical protein